MQSNIVAIIELLTFYLVVCNYIPNFPADFTGMFLDETYANGDGTDSWCTTNEQISADCYDDQIYSIPVCGAWSCLYGELRAGRGSAVIHKYTNSFCADRNLDFNPMHFLCM
jgi:hypothetical protein